MKTVTFNSMIDIFFCSPCPGVFGRWKTKLQDDDADLWLDLAFANHVPDEKPPPIPKVVSIRGESDDDEDVSTICGNTFEGASSSVLQERSYLLTTRREEKKEDDCSTMFGHDLELEVEERDRSTIKGGHCLDYTDVDDASLESIMGPRSCRSTTSSRPPQASLRQQQREQYQRFIDSFSYSFNTSEDQKECPEDEYDADGSSYSSLRQKISMHRVSTTMSAHREGPSLLETALRANTNSLSSHTSSTMRTGNRIHARARTAPAARLSKKRSFVI